MDDVLRQTIDANTSLVLLLTKAVSAIAQMSERLSAVEQHISIIERMNEEV
jgi:hypothetical protein